MQQGLWRVKDKVATPRAGNQGQSKELYVPGIESVDDRVECERNQIMSPQNMPLSHEDYFESKAIEKKQIQENLSVLLLFA